MSKSCAIVSILRPTPLIPGPDRVYWKCRVEVEASIRQRVACERSATDESPLLFEAGLPQDRGNLVVKEVIACVVKTRGG